MAVPVLVALGATACSGPSVGHGAPVSAEPIELTVLHTNDLWGETEPCG